MSGFAGPDTDRAESRPAWGSGEVGKDREEEQTRMGKGLGAGDRPTSRPAVVLKE
ncbi:MAG: hypothetical protein ACREI3_01680 [Nitrospirales bacterium]